MTEHIETRGPSRFEAEAHRTPLWLRAVNAALPVATQIVVHGNIRDLHLVPSDTDGSLEFQATTDAIWEVLASNGFDALLVHNPLEGVVLFDSFRRPGWQPSGMVEQALKTELPSIINFIQTTTEARLAVLLDYVSQSAPPDVDTTVGIGHAMLTSLRAVHLDRRFRHEQRPEAVHHPVIWLVDRPNDLPHWMLTGDGIRQVPVGLPDLASRALVAEVLAPERFGPQYPGRFADATESLTVRGMIEASSLVQSSLEEDPDIEAAVRAYRVGVAENPWRNQQLREKLRDGLGHLESRVIGQRHAVQRVLDLIVRSAMGLTAAHQAKAGAGVRGVLYFAGPTGVGKTEMAKAIAELVFGKDEALIRFDMSEFAQEGSEARLIGAPPGYVGHSAGGELTNAVRRRPFSVILFDEIDKAHGRILDKFLQILSDGRLTDGSGDTVFFTDTIIVFTSNQGVIDTADIDTTTEEGVVEYGHRIRSSVEHFFTHKLNRPELLGRIGDNIIAFRPIAIEFAQTIALRNLDNIERRVQEATGHRLTIASDVRDELVKMATRDLSKGGRGIGLTLEAAFVNPLARSLFAVAPGVPVRVTSILADEDGSPRVQLAT